MKREGQHRRRRPAWLSFFVSPSFSFFCGLKISPVCQKIKAAPIWANLRRICHPRCREQRERERKRERQRERARARVYCKSALAQPTAAAAFNGKERDRDELSTHTQLHIYVCTYLVAGLQYRYNQRHCFVCFLLLLCCCCCCFFFCIRFIYFVHVLCPFLDTHAHTHTKWFSLFMLRQMQHEITKAKVEREGKRRVARPN